MIKLNGWQRLWIFFSGLLLALICVFTFIIWPNPENTFHRDQFYKNLSVASQTIIIEDEHGFIPDSKGDVGIRGEMPNGHIILFSSKATRDQENKAAQEYWKEVTKETSKERLSIAWGAFLIWSIISVVLYILGLTIAWVIAGFKKHKD